ncbi:tryptophan--tRNA ligase [Longirhabdus pacifica]|uniref:tryptophan--tRNA ligase n=1 Tax=Longirhabdus pacifica TaxID=2305227 RepID=UPI0010090F49|nr:tryptophan--tRNA ligase [Longirhabdus pacifica]
MKRVMSGMQSSGTLTMGNYIGAILNYKKLQDDPENECFFTVVDLHAITTPQDPKLLKEQTEAVAALYFASGIDADKSAVFLQSHVPAHAEMGWIMNTLSYMGELERMTQFKDKSQKHQESIPSGLFTYPTLMAGDMLLYQADIVPVGEDQKQHIELTRDLAQRFNQRYGETFKIPSSEIPEVGARIMSLQDAKKKMSKSDENQGGFITMVDEPNVIKKKIMRATTDSGNEVRFDKEEKPEISNLMTIYSCLSGISIKDIEKKYDGLMYGAFKKDLVDVVVEQFSPIQQKYKEIRESGSLYHMLQQGAEKAHAVADRTIEDVKEKMGFVLPVNKLKK